ncbi:hypothetical protein Q5H92_12630 [Hymenobacter sp. M29]|uniref:Uncharacterized protein n=1 Tax=Hymenobacter mellowenesis TaxID=3063995 RepID=A0ABT9ABI7_9BACT|nr:hypothetical protein [Hymenobacter sp. M29]MDO7847210.1 hypothetical protein [Hymenobacter sp. M29]
MKYLLSSLLCLPALLTLAQQPSFTVRPLSLPKELEFYDNQFSGLAISRGQLFLLSESRLQDKAEAKLYTVPLSDLDRKLRDSTYVLPYQKVKLTGLTALQARMKAAGQEYEGLEALMIAKDIVYLSVETATPSANCYLLKGRLHANTVALDTTFLLALPKPPAADGSHIYNAGFEATVTAKRELVAFFEYNSFPDQNYAYAFRKPHLTASSSSHSLPFSSLPFRITDITPVGRNHFTAINYFFKGAGGDTIYRPPATDVANTRLITGPGGFKNYCRLVDITLKSNRFTWQPLWEFPEAYMGYNWEGLAAYKQGYFVINDKYTPSRPYRTTLLYLQRNR